MEMKATMELYNEYNTSVITECMRSESFYVKTGAKSSPVCGGDQ